MKIKGSVVFSIFFFLVTISIPVIQAFKELSDKESIQFFDIFEDTFITPISNYSKNISTFDKVINELNSAVNKIPVVTDSGNTNESSNIGLHIEEALALVEDVKRLQINVNRYYSDSTFQHLSKFDTLIQKYHDAFSLIENVPDRSDKALVTVKNLINLTSELRKEITLSPFQKLKLPIVHFFKYTVFNKNYLRKYEKEMENTSVFALAIRPVVQFIRYSLLHDVGDKAILGQNGWLFYKPDVEYLYRPTINDPRSVVVDYNDKALNDDPVGVIIDFQKQLASMGIDLLVVVVPGKPSIYPDLIDESIRLEKSESFSHSYKIIEILKNKGVAAVDLFTPFLEARNLDTLFGDSLYLKTDTHWKTRGPRLAAKIVATDIKNMSWFLFSKPVIEYEIDSVEIWRNGDVGTMTKLADFKIRELQLNLPLEKTKCYQVFSIKRDESGSISTRELYKDDYRSSRILILGDSFSRIYQTDEPRGAGWIAHLAYELSEPVGSIVNDGGASTIVRQILSRKTSLLKGKKLVVWQFVERDFRFGAEGWQFINLSAGNFKE